MSYNSYLRTMYYGSRIIEMNERDVRRAEKERQQRVGAEFKKIQPFFDRASELTNGLEKLLQNKNSYLTVDQVLDVIRVIEDEYSIACKYISKEARKQLRINIGEFKNDYINKFNYEIERRRHYGC